MTGKRKWLELNNLASSYEDRLIFNNFNLNLYLNEYTIILGPNGSGKSTLIKLINRSIYPFPNNDSSIKILDQEFINIWYIRSRIGFISTEVEIRIMPNMIVKDIILSGFFGTIGINKNDHVIFSQLKALEKLATAFQLLPLLNKRYSQLSDGEKRKILIARAVIPDPDILILDEPTIRLDVKSSFLVLELLQLLRKQGKTILHITHEINTIPDDVDNIILLKDGQIFANGSPKNILKSDLLSLLFDINIDIKLINNYWHAFPYK